VPDDFVPLSTFLKPSRNDEEIVEAVSSPAKEAASADARDLREIASEMRRFRAALRDAFEASREALLRDIACGVLGRELALQPANLNAIAARIVAEIGTPVRIRVHPDDAAALEEWECELVPDASVRPGDIVFEVNDGSVDASLGIRLDEALAAAAQ
jgi:flagellar biosynthesis/type III secretory pathway protein FliH